MGETIWGNRTPLQAAYKSLQDEDVVVIDASISPDYLMMPDDPSIPDDIRGSSVKVYASIWLNFGIRPGNPDRGEPATVQVDKRSRWHLLQTEHDLVCIEVEGVGFVIIGVGEKRMSYLKSLLI